jgi:hypothetical protein
MVLYNGFNAATVPWGLFDERIKKAQTVLEQAANIGGICPQWYSEMMTIGAIQLNELGTVPAAGATSRMKNLFDRGIQLEAKGKS